MGNVRALCRSLYLVRKFFILFSRLVPIPTVFYQNVFVVPRPGTGKTITVIECIRQLLDKDPRAKVLACAPSNSAADLIALHLRRNLSKDDLFRFYAPSRFGNQVPDDLRPLQVKSEFCRPLTERHGPAAHKVGLPRSLIQISDLAKILS